MSEFTSEVWQQSNLQVFWGEIAPCDHVVQIYENDTVFLHALEGFVGSGLLAGDSVIIIATAAHLLALERRLIHQGFDVDTLRASDRFIGLDAAETLSKFMVNNWPDEMRFNQLITSLLNRVKQQNRKVRAFGEMVALLWQQGLNGATVQLEALWNLLHHNDKFSLFCAYPKVGFTQDISSSINAICSAHSKVINGLSNPSTEIYYKTAS
jgi:hypothetical protein